MYVRNSGLKTETEIKTIPAHVMDHVCVRKLSPICLLNLTGAPLNDYKSLYPVLTDARYVVTS